MEDRKAERARAGRIALGGRLRDRREAEGLTLAALAQGSGMSLSYLSDVERGRRLPALDALDRVCAALGTTVVELLAGVYPFGADRPPRRLAPPPDGRSAGR